MYKYETHCHTSPVSKCAKATVRQTVEFYKSLGYDGIFITNHFLDGNINTDPNENYETKINFYFSDYEAAVAVGKEIGIKIFDGIELSYSGTDFLVYGLHKEWFLQNPQIMKMQIKEKLSFLQQNGGFVVQAHPFREASYIDHIRLFPRCVDAVEVINANRTDFENEMAQIYAKKYDLKSLAGTDNHIGEDQERLAGVQSKKPINSVADFISLIKNDGLELFGL